MSYYQWLCNCVLSMKLWALVHGKLFIYCPLPFSLNYRMCLVGENWNENKGLNLSESEMVHSHLIFPLSNLFYLFLNVFFTSRILINLKMFTKFKLYFFCRLLLKFKIK